MPNNTLTRMSNLLDWIPSRTPSSSLARLSSLYRRPGPFATVYLATTADGLPGLDCLDENWQRQRAALEGQGAPSSMVRAIDRRLVMDRPPRAAGVCVVAAEDGTTLVDHDTIAPVSQAATLRALPSVGQLLEWHQRRIPTLVAHIADGRAAISPFAVEELRRNYTIVDSPPAMTHTIAKLATAVEARLVLVAGSDRHAQAVAGALQVRLPLTCRVVTEAGPETAEELAGATVRQVGIAAAGTTLRYLREERFLATHGAAVDGIESTVKTLWGGDAEILLVHDNPSDERTLWVGAMPRQISVARTTDCVNEVRLVDGLLRSAIQQRIAVRMIPAIGPQGPADDVAVVTMAGGLLVDE